MDQVGSLVARRIDGRAVAELTINGRALRGEGPTLEIALASLTLAVGDYEEAASQEVDQDGARALVHFDGRYRILVDGAGMASFSDPDDAADAWWAFTGRDVTL